MNNELDDILTEDEKTQLLNLIGRIKVNEQFALQPRGQSEFMILFNLEGEVCGIATTEGFRSMKFEVPDHLVLRVK